MSPQVTTSRRRVRYAAAAVAALPQPLSSFPTSLPQFGPSVPLLGNEAGLPPCGRPDRVFPGSCRRPWGLPGAGRGGCAALGPALVAGLPPPGSSRGSIDGTPAGVELRRRGGGGPGARGPAGAGCARGYRAPSAGRIPLSQPPGRDNPAQPPPWGKGGLGDGFCFTLAIKVYPRV